MIFLNTKAHYKVIFKKNRKKRILALYILASLFISAQPVFSQQLPTTPSIKSSHETHLVYSKTNITTKTSPQATKGITKNATLVLNTQRAALSNTYTVNRTGLATLFLAATSNDTTAPTISAVMPRNITYNSVVIGWSTNETSNSQVEYGPTETYGNATYLKKESVTSHSVLITNLSKSTVYHYRVKSRDSAGNLTISRDFTFKTNTDEKSALDTTAPTITGVIIINITTTGAKVGWNTSEASTTQIEYGLTTSYGMSLNAGAALTLTHAQTLSNLTPRTLYHVRVKSADGAGNLSVSGDLTFTTLSSTSDTTPPTFSLIKATNVATGSVAISWQTNELSNSQVEYGTTTTYGFSTLLAPALVLAHTQTIASLQIGTLYHYRVKSRDGAGNLAVSQDQTFVVGSTTPPGGGGGGGGGSSTPQVVFDHSRGHLFIVRKAELESWFGSFTTSSIQSQLLNSSGSPINATMLFIDGDLYIIGHCMEEVIATGTLVLSGRSAFLTVSMTNCDRAHQMDMTSQMLSDQESIMNLFPSTGATHRAVRSGRFEDAATWGGVIPGAGAKIIIENAAVVVNSQLSSSYQWLFVGENGFLIFNPDVNTQIIAKTIGVGEEGGFLLGTVAHPISSNVTSSIKFTPRDSVDIAIDTRDIGGGLLAVHNSEISIQGTVTTNKINAARIPTAGDRQITLLQVPINWKVGGHIMLPSAIAGGVNQELVITSISQSGLVITLDRAVAVTPQLPAGFSYPVVYTDRNVQLSSTSIATRLNRAHMMLMSPASIQYALFTGMGREDKLRPLTDDVPPTNPQSNQRARYVIHFHRTGTDQESVVRGAVVKDSPGWQFVNHGSFVRFEDNVSINATGAAFVTEAGDEIGTFERNVVIGVTGTGDADNLRSESSDYGYRGNGFWIQGTAVNIFDNSVWNVKSAGIGVYAQALAGIDKVEPSTIPVASLRPIIDSSIFGGVTFISPTQFPMKILRNTIVGSEREAIRTYYLGNSNENIRFTIEGNTMANVYTGILTFYAHNFNILNNVADNSIQKSGQWGWTGGQDTNTSGYMRVENNRFIGFSGGVYLPPNGIQYVKNNFFDSSTGVSLNTNASVKREANIENNSFSPATLTKVDLSYSRELAPNDQLFYQDKILFTEPGRQTVQLFFSQQNASFVPFHNTGTVLDELTNAQLKNAYGLMMGGALTPSDATHGTSQRINAYVGTPVSYARPLYYSDTTTNPSHTPQFSTRERTVVYTGSLVTLHPGINVIPTRGVDPLTNLPLTAIVNYVASGASTVTLEVPLRLRSAVVSSFDTSIFISLKAFLARQGGVTQTVTINTTVPLVHAGNNTAVANFLVVDPVTRAEYWQSLRFTESASIPRHLSSDWWRL